MTLARGVSVLVAALIVVALVITTRGPAVMERTQVDVVKVVDGDTVKVRDQTLHMFTVRIIGIDTPETVHPSEPVQCYGPEASQFAKDFLAGRSVTLAYDSRADGLDKYGRTLAYVELDGADYGLAAIKAGTARERTYEPYDRQTKYRNAQAAAERELAGLWKECR